jgi:hypothetical protein
MRFFRTVKFFQPLAMCGVIALSPAIPVGVATAKLHHPETAVHADVVLPDVSPRVGMGTLDIPHDAMYVPNTRGAALLELMHEEHGDER